MIVGITGSSGAGKSEVSKLLAKEYDAYLIDADKIAKNLSKENADYLNEIVVSFGQEILKKDGTLNRKRLGEIIYNSEEKRELLNSITFKYIVSEIKILIEKNHEKKAIIIDAPLLFESGLNNICDTIIGVIAKKEIKVKRLIARDSLEQRTLEKRIDSQKDDDFFVKNCNIVIENNFATQEELKRNIEEKTILKEIFKL